MNLKLLVENTSPFDTDRAGTRFFAKRKQEVAVNELGFKEIQACRVLKVLSIKAPDQVVAPIPQKTVRKVITPERLEPLTVTKTEDISPAGPDEPITPERETPARTHTKRERPKGPRL